MKNNNTKYWFFTWEVNVSQRKLPSKDKLKELEKDKKNRD